MNFSVISSALFSFNPEIL
jgi:hypothetical protein